MRDVPFNFDLMGRQGLASLLGKARQVRGARIVFELAVMGGQDPIVLHDVAIDDHTRLLDDKDSVIVPDPFDDGDQCIPMRQVLAFRFPSL